MRSGAKAIAALVGPAAFAAMCSGNGFAQSNGALEAIRPSVVFIYLANESEVGSGVIVRTSAAATYVVTAAHVVRAGSDIDVFYENDLSHPHRARVFKVDDKKDLAVLEIDGLAPAQASLSDESTSGSSIAVLGYPAEATERMIDKTGAVEPVSATGEITSVREA